MLQKAGKLIFQVSNMSLAELKAAVAAGCRIVEGENLSGIIIDNKPIFSTRFIVPFNDQTVLIYCLKALFKRSNKMEVSPDNDNTLTFKIKDLQIDYLETILKSGWVINPKSFIAKNENGKPLFSVTIKPPSNDREAIAAAFEGLLGITIG